MFDRTTWFLLALVAAAGGWYAWSRSADDPQRASAQTRAAVIDVAYDLAGGHEQRHYIAVKIEDDGCPPASGEHAVFVAEQDGGGPRELVRVRDGWNMPLRAVSFPYDRGWLVESAGPDGQFGTPDDIDSGRHLVKENDG